MQFDSRLVQVTRRSIAITVARILSVGVARAAMIALIITLLSAPAAMAQYTENVLYSFCSVFSGSSCTDGDRPYAGLIFDSRGNLYGTTFYGGNASGCSSSSPPWCGVVFEVSPPSSGTGPWTETVLYSFTGGTDGGGPFANLIFDSRGNLYGTTVDGGATGYGVVFELSPPRSGSGPWTETVLYTFCSTGTCTDGEYPYGGVILDSQGNLYGTAQAGGDTSVCPSYWCGVAFELNPPTSGSGAWTETVLHSFTGGSDGGGPSGSLIFDSHGNLYGTTTQGGDTSACLSGVNAGCGVVFELSPPTSASGAWTETVLHSFTGGSDGEGPGAPLVFDTRGNLYGTAAAGGTSKAGVLLELSPSGSGPWTETVLYSFTGGSDGAGPEAPLVFDSRGNLYGTAFDGGNLYCGYVEGCGVAFELRPPATGSGSWTETVLYTFCTLIDCTDGKEPYAGMILDSHGNLYGTTFYGGANDQDVGEVFELATNTATAVTSSLNPSTVGESVTFTATVNGGYLPTGTVGFTANGVAINGCGSITLSAGKAQCTTFSLPGGSNSILAAYSGDSNNGGSSGTLTQTVTLFATTIAVTSSLNPSTVDESVTFTATISGGSSPTGTVGLTSNGTIISGCGAVTLASDKAECTTTFTAKGSYAIVATYSGDSKNAGSSGTLTQVVGATTTTVTSSLNPSTSGESITLTATVAPAGPPTPTGTVGFTSLGSAITGCSDVTLATSRTAECTTTTLPVGTDAVLATYSGDTNYSGSSGTFSQLVNPIPTPVQFFTMTPCRIVDTRGPDGYFGGPEFTAGETRNFTLPVGPCAGIPTNASAYSLNVTVVPPGPLGYLTIWPTGEGQPTVSTLNSLDGRTKANAAIVPAGTSGAVSVYVNNTSNVLLDIDGYFATSGSGSLEFYPLTPCRVADTRKATGPLGGPALVAKTERDFPILSSSCGIPSAAQAYSLNFTVVPPATGDVLDYLTVWPEGEAQPVVSTLNNFTGTIVANAALVPAGTSGGVAVYPSNATNLLIDVNGYFAAPGTVGYNLYTLTPCRLLDTRKTTGAFTGKLTVSVATSACAPSSADKAYVFNATVIPTGDLGYLTLWPDEETQPVVSTLNAADGAITSNLAIVPNKDGETDADASGTTQLVLDISAYFAP